ncbi:metallophosphoesterase family protein [Granulosicoccus antarcticus]|uniref:Bis(5'-nucleosyl)-tetraphosphatase PrpE (Asymmetrical) n=1 Tax=Granulosicoccus antarcticus IMCC3135 TaxID=1192854 RepID=A0A2Z2NSS5_9GAMM|nr:metallophosphoesterase family protein [Granulosicoccus antarcticus]ASJ73565.1 Bis(5'-nucleosyl)-tetraphosphatase PrpE (asymmetrical) [Granulosicoccus antarcticus IMCC3135]
MKKRIYVIGDVHGELDMLQCAIDKIEADGGADAKVVFLGDYVDRGAQSKEVIEFLIEGLSVGKNWLCLLGNHDRMFSLFMQDSPQADVRLPRQYTWLHDRIGGKETLASYGINAGDGDHFRDAHKRARATVPEAHLKFLESLEYFHQEDDFLFVHAGIRPGIPFKQQDKNDLVWIRGEFLESKKPHPWLVVHGHTPVEAARHYGNRVCLDTGSGYGRQLTCAVFEGADCWLLTDGGRTPLLPEPLD